MDHQVENDLNKLNLSAEEPPITRFSSWIKAGRSLDIQDKDGRTALHNYANIGYAETVKFLLEHGADPNIRDNCGRTPLHFASQRDGLLHLFMGRVTSLDVQDDGGLSPLHYACMRECVENVLLLLENKATVEIMNKNGQTPFHFAAKRSSLEVVLMFIARGINIDLQDNFGYTALHYACKNGFLEDCRVVQCLLRNGANPNLRECCGETSLHFAAKCFTSDFLNLLLTEGNLDIDVEDNSGWTPLLYAIKTNQFHNVRLLIDKGAFIDSNGASETRFFSESLTIFYQETPLHIASVHSLKALKYLLEKGALVGVKNSEGFTQLSEMRKRDVWLYTDFKIYYKKHILKFQLLHPVDENVDDATNLEEGELTSCLAEVKKIKSTKVAEVFSLYEFVAQRDRPDYLFDADLKTRLEAFLGSPDFLDEFPNYGTILRSQLIRSERSRYFLSRQALIHIFGNSHVNCLARLPQLVWTKIFSLVSDHDMYNFTKCVSRQMSFSSRF